MIPILILSILLNNNLVSAQNLDTTSWNYAEVVTDSVVWKTVSVDSLNLGDENCEHEWVYSETRRAGGDKGCLVLHYGFHCSWADRMRDRICKKCFRKETRREFWYQHRLKKPESEYEILKKRLK